MARTGLATSVWDEFAESPVEMLKIFVYGTLKPGEANYERYCRDQIVTARAAIALGQLYDLPLGYPAMTSGKSPVQGFLLSFIDPNLLVLLDQLEDYCPSRPADQNEYLRVRAEVYSLDYEVLGQAWVYQMQLQQVHKLGGVLLPKGYWTSQERR